MYRFERFFNNCCSFITLSDITNWNTSIVIDMDCMLYSCLFLASLPGISKWDVSNVVVFEHMLTCCHSLFKFPDISKWKIGKAKKLGSIFYLFDNMEIFARYI